MEWEGVSASGDAMQPASDRAATYLGAASTGPTQNTAKVRHAIAAPGPMQVHRNPTPRSEGPTHG